MASTSGDARTKNQKLFRKYGMELSSSDLKVYAQSAMKMAKWLNSERAYYEDARPIIVGLIETAQETLRKLVNDVATESQIQTVNDVSRCCPQLRDWVDAYVELVKATVPYLGLFKEPHLRERMQGLIQSLFTSSEEAHFLASETTAETSQLQPELTVSKSQDFSNPDSLQASNVTPIPSSSSLTETDEKRKSLASPDRGGPVAQSPVSKVGLENPAEHSDGQMSSVERHTPTQPVDPTTPSVLLDASTFSGASVPSKVKRKKKPTLPRIDVMSRIVAKDLHEYERKKVSGTPGGGCSTSPQSVLAVAPEGKPPLSNVLSAAPEPDNEANDDTKQSPSLAPARSASECIVVPDVSALHPPTEGVDISTATVIPGRSMDQKEVVSDINPNQDVEISEKETETYPSRSTPKDEMQVETLVITEPLSIQSDVPETYVHDVDSTIRMDILPDEGNTAAPIPNIAEDEHITPHSAIMEANDKEEGELTDNEDIIAEISDSPSRKTERNLDDHIPGERMAEISAEVQTTHRQLPTEDGAGRRTSLPEGTELTSGFPHPPSSDSVNDVPSSENPIFAPPEVLSQPTHTTSGLIQLGLSEEVPYDSQQSIGSLAVNGATESRRLPIASAQESKVEGVSTLPQLIQSSAEINGTESIDLSPTAMTVDRVNGTEGSLENQVATSVSCNGTDVEQTTDSSALFCVSGDTGVGRQVPEVQGLEANSDSAFNPTTEPLPMPPMDIDVPALSQGLPTTVDSTRPHLPSANGIHGVTQKPPMDVDEVPVQVQPVSFGPEMVVIASLRGSSTRSTITVDFELDEIQFEYLSMWNSRKRDVSDSLCVSLGCYPSAQLDAIITQSTELPSEAEITSSLPCAWPQNGGLNIRATYNGKSHKFPLSPPFHVTPNNLFDISPFLTLGKNVIQIQQSFDMSAHTYFLRVHSPTEAQLQEISRSRRRNEEWEHKLRNAVAPLPLSLPRWKDILAKA